MTKHVMTSAASCRHVKQCNLATPSKTSMRTCHTAELVCHWLGLGAARHSDGTMPCSNLKMTMCDSRCRDWCPPPLRRDSHISAGAHHGSGRDVCSAICRDKVQRTSLMKIAASIDITSRGSWDSSGTFSEPALEPACMLSYRPHSEALKPSLQTRSCGNQQNQRQNVVFPTSRTADLPCPL